MKRKKRLDISDRKPLSDLIEHRQEDPFVRLTKTKEGGVAARTAGKGPQYKYTNFIRFS